MRIREGVKAELDRLEKIDARTRRLADAKKRITEDILTLHCPSCHAAFVDFQGCCVLSCHRCATYFCGWCATTEPSARMSRRCVAMRDPYPCWCSLAWLQVLGRLWSEQ